MVPPIEYDLGYRSRNKVQPNHKTDPNPNHNPKSNINVCSTK